MSTIEGSRESRSPKLIMRTRLIPKAIKTSASGRSLIVMFLQGDAIHQARHIAHKIVPM